MDKYPPSGEELRQYFATHLAGVNRREVGAMLKVNPRTVDYWKAGKVQIPYSCWFTLRTIVEGKPPTTEEP